MMYSRSEGDRADIQGVEDAAHTGHALIKLQVAVVVPHEAADPVHVSMPCDFGALATCWASSRSASTSGDGCRLLGRHDFDFRIKFRTSAKDSRH